MLDDVRRDVTERVFLLSRCEGFTLREIATQLNPEWTDLLPLSECFA
jgi:hypothetical protein